MERISSSDAANLLGVSRNTLLRWFREKRVTDVGRDYRGWRVFERNDIERIRRELGAASEQLPTDARTRRRRSYLGSVPAFKDLSDSALDALGDCARFRGELSGHTLFFPGDRVEGLYILVKGKVRIYRSSPDGREQTLSIITPYQTFGEAEIFRVAT